MLTNLNFVESVIEMIEGDRVKLRPIRQDDLSLLRQWASDPTLMRFWANPNPIVSDRHFEDDLEGRFAKFDTSGYFIVEDQDGAPIGRIEFERLSDHERSAEVMILIGDENVRGQGYGADAMVTLLRFIVFHQAGYASRLAHGSRLERDGNPQL